MQLLPLMFAAIVIIAVVGAVAFYAMHYYTSLAGLPKNKAAGGAVYIKEVDTDRMTALVVNNFGRTVDALMYITYTNGTDEAVSVFRVELAPGDNLVPLSPKWLYPGLTGDIQIETSKSYMLVSGTKIPLSSGAPGEVPISFFRHDYTLSVSGFQAKYDNGRRLSLMATRPEFSIRYELDFRSGYKRDPSSYYSVTRTLTNYAGTSCKNEKYTIWYSYWGTWCAGYNGSICTSTTSGCIMTSDLCTSSKTLSPPSDVTGTYYCTDSGTGLDLLPSISVSGDVPLETAGSMGIDNSQYNGTANYFLAKTYSSTTSATWATYVDRASCSYVSHYTSYYYNADGTCTFNFDDTSCGSVHVTKTLCDLGSYTSSRTLYACNSASDDCVDPGVFFKDSVESITMNATVFLNTTDHMVHFNITGYIVLRYEQVIQDNGSVENVTRIFLTYTLALRLPPVVGELVLNYGDKLAGKPSFDVEVHLVRDYVGYNRTETLPDDLGTLEYANAIGTGMLTVTTDGYSKLVSPVPETPVSSTAKSYKFSETPVVYITITNDDPDNGWVLSGRKDSEYIVLKYVFVGYLEPKLEVTIHSIEPVR